MSRLVFVDTSAFIALENASDTVHATTIAVIERLGIRHVFAFDDHFRQYARLTLFP